jgi:hypothetical protein
MAELLVRHPKVLTERKFRPVKLWAGIGVVALIIQAVAYAGWFLSGEFVSTPTGDTPIPTPMMAAIRVWEVGAIIASATMVWFLLIKPWRRDGRISLDGMFTLAMITIIWQDTFINFFQTSVVYNSGFVNRGSWYPHILGWVSPNTNRIATPLLGFAPGGYMFFWLGMMMVGCWVMRKAKQRWPQLGTFGLIMVSFGFFVVFDFVAELSWMRLGFYAYPGGISWLTVFHGHYYQFPIYVCVLGGIWYATFTGLRYFRNDKGETFAERGLSEWALPARARSVIRFLAIVGACNVAFMSSNIPWIALSMYSSSWPDDVTKRSYLMDGVCGPNTDYACPGPGVPIPRPHSAHLDPNGHLVFP